MGGSKIPPIIKTDNGSPKQKSKGYNNYCFANSFPHNISFLERATQRKRWKPFGTVETHPYRLPFGPVIQRDICWGGGGLCPYCSDGFLGIITVIS